MPAYPWLLTRSLTLPRPVHVRGDRSLATRSLMACILACDCFLACLLAYLPLRLRICTVRYFSAPLPEVRAQLSVVMGDLWVIHMDALVSAECAVMDCATRALRDLVGEDPVRVWPQMPHSAHSGQLADRYGALEDFDKFKAAVCDATPGLVVTL